MVGCNLEKITKENLLYSKLKIGEKIIAEVINYDLKIKKGQTTGNKNIYITNKERILIHDDGGAYSGGRVYALDFYGIEKLDENKGYSLLIDYSYTVDLKFFITILDMINFREYFHMYLDFSKEPTIVGYKNDFEILDKFIIKENKLLLIDRFDNGRKIDLENIEEIIYVDNTLKVYFNDNKEDFLYIFNIGEKAVNELMVFLPQEV